MKGQWGKLLGYMLVTGIVTTLIVMLPFIFGGTGWLPDTLSREGDSIDALFWGLVILSIVIFAIVGGLVLYSMVHFRAAPGDMSDGEHIHGNARVEIAWIAIPSLIVLVLGIISYDVLQENEVGLFDKAAAKDKGAATLQVDVRGFSFGWGFRFVDVDSGEPIGDFDANPASELVLPVDQVVKFDVMSCSGKEHLGRIREQTLRELAAGDEHNEFAEIEPGLCERHWDATTKADQDAARDDAEHFFHVKTALQDGKDISEDDQEFWDQQPRFHGDQQFSDVNHSFWVPEARLKVDAVAGLRTYVQWTPDRVTGPDDLYQVVCAELCGSGHNGMRTDVCIVDQGVFDWYVGLGADDRTDATCVNLRRVSCLEDPGDLNETVAAIAELTSKDPEASCDDVEEQVA